jgi:hypothetical protein
MRQCFYGIGNQAAFDGNDLPRVYGRRQNADIAETYCWEELGEYLRRRREMRLDEFHFEIKAQ